MIYLVTLKTALKKASTPSRGPVQAHNAAGQSPSETCSHSSTECISSCEVGLAQASLSQFKTFSRGSYHSSTKINRTRVGSLGLWESDDLRQHDLRIHGAGYIHQRPNGGLEDMEDLWTYGKTSVVYVDPLIPYILNGLVEGTIYRKP